VGSVRFWDSQVGTGIVMLCQGFRPEERGKIRAELSLGEFPLFLGFWEERGQMERIRKCRGEIAEIGKEGDAMWMWCKVKRIMGMERGGLGRDVDGQG